MTVPCINCNTITTLETHFEVITFACPNCSYSYINRRDEGLKFHKKGNPYYFDEKFTLGQKATFGQLEYKITGILVKENNGFEWIEYILEGAVNDYIYLSESAGHWIVLTEIPFETKVGNHPLRVAYEGSFYDRYNYSYPTLLAAKGFFDFDIYEKRELIEYIKPPFMLSFEILGQDQTTFLGKHISRKEIKKAFGVDTLPSKKGIGTIQPFIFDIRNLAISFCVVAIGILLTNWFLNKDRVEQNILDIELPFYEYTIKNYVTPSFQLEGSAAPLTISLKTDVDNSWANVQVTLINEKTGQEEYATKDIEYYHGYTDGENWTEGDTREEFNICGVAAGKYHLSISPMKAPEDFQNQKVQIQVNWSSPSSRNVGMVFLFMAIFVIGMFYLEKNFEERRWNE